MALQIELPLLHHVSSSACTAMVVTLYLQSDGGSDLEQFRRNAEAPAPYVPLPAACPSPLSASGAWF